MPLVASRNGLRRTTRIDRRSSAVPNRGPPRAGSVRLEAVARREARADRDVALARAHSLEQPGELLDRMLAVRVHPTAEGVAVLQRILVAGGDPGRQAPVGVERDHLRAVLAGNLGSPVGRAVVDDEDVGFGKHAPNLVQHRWEALLVPGGQEDEGVAVGRHGASLASPAVSYSP
jgi:hypothetical protein